MALWQKAVTEIKHVKTTVINFFIKGDVHLRKQS
jgi:hypothetical protein